MCPDAPCPADCLPTPLFFSNLLMCVNSRAFVSEPAAVGGVDVEGSSVCATQIF